MWPRGTPSVPENESWEVFGRPSRSLEAPTLLPPKTEGNPWISKTREIYTEERLRGLGLLPFPLLTP